MSWNKMGSQNASRFNASHFVFFHSPGFCSLFSFPTSTSLYHYFFFCDVQLFLKPFQCWVLSPTGPVAGTARECLAFSDIVNNERCNQLQTILGRGKYEHHYETLRHGRLTVFFAIQETRLGTAGKTFRMFALPSHWNIFAIILVTELFGVSYKTWLCVSREPTWLFLVGFSIQGSVWAFHIQ